MTPMAADALASSCEKGQSDRPAEWTRLVVRVVDSGSGLSADELATLRNSEAFTQVGKGQLQGAGGTGLGLGIARQILKLHDGSTLSLASDGHGCGTVAEMHLVCSLAHPHTPSASGAGRGACARLGDNDMDPAIQPRAEGAVALRTGWASCG
jgi:signal transduction histidine kinase